MGAVSHCTVTVTLHCTVSMHAGGVSCRYRDTYLGITNKRLLDVSREQPQWRHSQPICRHNALTFLHPRPGGDTGFV